ncbi:MAG: 3-deoxy-manno-octulosonate cytidylyltransferase [Alphaproteobacteria bacterium]|nr:MAG: 3-deoxy-manno-octulosonate cytidylyltransferase [Alphaproteobacteria bacterium]
MQNLNPIIIIPARLAATRLPNKPLADINGKPMIVRVYDRALAADLGPVVVAAGDKEIVDVITKVKGKAILTDPALPSGSDRIWAAIQSADPTGLHEVIINLQGDLPDIDPHTLQAILNLMQDSKVDIATAAARIPNLNEAEKPNVVKIAMHQYGKHSGRALYFSRSLIPHGAGEHWHHIGIYAYRRKALEKFIASPPSALESREKLEQLRALELGLRIDVALVDRVPIAIDTPEDLELARRLIK